MLNKTQVQTHLQDLKINNFTQLEKLFETTKSGKLQKTTNPNLEQEGVYAFWWTGDNQLKNKIREGVEIQLQGRGGSTETIKYSEEWLKAAEHEGRICLYVGKGKISNRLSQHIKVQTGNRQITNEKPDTSSQLRYGLERIFKSEFEKDDCENCYTVVKFILKNVSITFVKEENAVNRFYFEDLAIGSLFPIFNLDIER